jgi:outer membrane lipoprotein carrier protein
VKIRLLKAVCTRLLPLVVSATTAATLLAQAPVNAPRISTAEDYALTQLASILQQTTTLSAEVEQLIIDQDGRELQEASVKLLMQKPASFRWEIFEPHEELMVTDGSLIWHYEPDLEQVTIQAFDADLDRTPVMLLNGSAESIGSSYAVSASTMTDGIHTRFVLQPKQPDSLFESMSLTFNGADLEEMQFEDSRGQRTSLTFRQIRRNQTIDAGQFHYTPPAGVEVIDSTLE